MESVNIFEKGRFSLLSDSNQYFFSSILKICYLYWINTIDIIWPFYVVTQITIDMRI